MTNSNIISMYHNTLEVYKIFAEPICEKYNLSHQAYEILMFLGINDEYYTAKDITKWRGIKPNMVSLYVEKLVHDGFLERQPVSNDRRRIKLVCTAKAEPVIEQGKVLLKTFFDNMTDGLTEPEIDTLLRCITVFKNNIVKMKQEIEEGIL